MPAEPLLFAEEITVIRDGVLAGESYSALARWLDRDRLTVARCARRLGLTSGSPGRRPWRPIDPVALSVARERIEAGDSFRKIAAALDCDPKTISNIAKRLGLKPNFSFGGSREIAA